MEGIPEPNIFWEKDGRILSHSSDFTTEFDGRKAKLSIRRVYPEDEGEYTCVVSNNIGRSYSSACIIVDGEFTDFTCKMSLKLNVLPFPLQCPRKKKISSVVNYPDHADYFQPTPPQYPRRDQPPFGVCLHCTHHTVATVVAIIRSVISMLHRNSTQSHTIEWLRRANQCNSNVLLLATHRHGPRGIKRELL